MKLSKSKYTKFNTLQPKNTFNSLRFLCILIFLLASCKNSKSPNSGKIKEDREQTTISSSKDADTVIKTARSFIGTKYKMGGSTRAGMDCSGLTFTCFKSVSINLPRTSSAQSQVGKNIKLDDIEKGDLVFFTDKKGHKKVTHVGLVTEVKKDRIKFIHSTTHLGVIENDLLSDYYKVLFLKAVRLF